MLVDQPLPQLSYLIGLAATLGVVHTISGPDHYIPFVAMSRAGGWTLRRTLVITGLCAFAHVASSILVGLVGIFVARLSADWLGLAEVFEGRREALAGWLLFGFGLAYAVWGLRRATRERAHHEHGTRSAMTPWVLFLIFAFGPCEVLIPMLMVPSAELGTGGLIVVTAVFTAATLVTMLAVVAAAYLGLGRLSERVPVDLVERYAHTAAGLAVALCGAAITVA